MRVAFKVLRITAVILTLMVSQGWQQADAVEPTDSRIAAAEKVASILQAADELRDPQMQISLFRSAADEVLQIVPANVFVQEAFQSVDQAEIADAGKRAKKWRAALIEAREILEFEPVEESPLPEGFPELTPVGEIRVQSYPAYRQAKTDMTLIEGAAFWTLFNHIKEREIAMTAPVEMTYSSEEQTPMKKVSMSFLYRSTQQGQLGTAGKVQVVDIPAQMAVSIGIRGSASKTRVADAQRRLEAWLQAHQDEYESAGPLRVLGHNSPFVAEKKQFAEVQIPVRAIHAADQPKP